MSLTPTKDRARMNFYWPEDTLGLWTRLLDAHQATQAAISEAAVEALCSLSLRDQRKLIKGRVDKRRGGVPG